MAGSGDLGRHLTRYLYDLRITFTKEEMIYPLQRYGQKVVKCLYELSQARKKVTDEIREQVTVPFAHHNHSITVKLLRNLARLLLNILKAESDMCDVVRDFTHQVG